MDKNIIQSRTSERMWKQNSLRFNVMLQIAGADVQIQDLDIDFDVYKNNKSTNNKSTITIWNLNDTTYQRILEKTYAVDLYTWYGDDEPSLLFRGYVNKDKTAKGNIIGRINTAKGFLESPVRKDIKGSFDIPTVIELIDGHVAYTQKTINKTYRSEVTSTQIIKDCIAAMGVGIAHFSKKLPEKKYNSYKAAGAPHVVLQKICKPLGIRFNVQNDLIQIVAPDEDFNGEYAVLLNPENSMRPERSGENELAVSTRLLPFLNPDDWVKCEFTEFEGVQQIRQVHSTGNNYGTEGKTDIIIGFDRLKAKKGKKKSKGNKNENL